ncbi:hydrolase [Gracilibacillus halophilus YIM-C55.5]|uniref:Hydrolase n=1 Tax=Gracilibacillus halophilus YIM-C55.5 TaxID=1308866 RepID=N4WCA0_9BACI|nr:HAD family hydrolase [Gracilibacillus halophilus]ENH96874.1 hydrolase [Gracilibacillus halophilus YIM-C55.5]
MQTKLNKQSKKNLTVFLDVGDTIIDERTQVHDDQGIVIAADVIPGADRMVKDLADKGYTLAVVADGKAQSFKNILTQNGLYDYFAAMIYSENIKELKPSPRMFKAAIGALDLSMQDIPRIVMVGNNLRRDILGANKLGITSVHLDWSTRYSTVARVEDEKPDYTIHQPMEFIHLIEVLNAQTKVKTNQG